MMIDNKTKIGEPKCTDERGHTFHSTMIDVLSDKGRIVRVKVCIECQLVIVEKITYA